MIKIRLTDWRNGRNQITFSYLLRYAKSFYNDIGIQFIEDGSYDFEFIGMQNFIDKKVSLQESIDKGLEYLSNNTGDYFLFDGSDSTSLMGAYEVFSQSNAQYLFKPAILEREDYKIPTAFNKWFFGSGSDLDLSYDIPESIYDRIKLTGWNLGYSNPNYLIPDTLNLDRTIDVCAIYQGHHDECYDHGARNDIYYTAHRTTPWQILSKSNNISYVTDKRPFDEFANVMRKSKCTISPFGMGEFCFRDFEIIQYGSIMIKPDMSRVKTSPDIFIPYETYIPCNHDWSDLVEKIEWVKANPIKCKEITENARNIMKSSFTSENLSLYWYNMIKTFKGVTV